MLSDDGQRVFFESFDKLVTRDTNGALDVYQWEANGKGNCTEAGGCVQLISNGQSPQGSEFVDADPTGNNVFFSTNSSLLPQDPGLIDIYAARVGGGFPQPPPPLPPCEGEACQRPAPAPNDPTPSSASFVGPGNPAAKKPKPCGKGKQKVKKGGKTRCVKKAKKSAPKKANNKSGGRSR